MTRPLTDRYERALQRLHEESPAPYRWRAAPRGRRLRVRFRLLLGFRRPERAASGGRRSPGRWAGAGPRPG